MIKGRHDFGIPPTTYRPLAALVCRFKGHEDALIDVEKDGDNRRAIMRCSRCNRFLDIGSNLSGDLRKRILEFRQRLTGGVDDKEEGSGSGDRDRDRDISDGGQD